MPTLPKPSQLINCSNLSSCLQNLYNLLFAIFVAMAFLYFLFGAFQYLLSGAGIYKKEEGKNKMKNSIIALIIVLVTPIILNMINPGIFKAELQIPKLTVTTTQLIGSASEINPEDALQPGEKIYDASPNPELANKIKDAEYITKIVVECSNQTAKIYAKMKNKEGEEEVAIVNIRTGQTVDATTGKKLSGNCNPINKYGSHTTPLSPPEGFILSNPRYDPNGVLSKEVDPKTGKRINLGQRTITYYAPRGLLIHGSPTKAKDEKFINTWGCIRMKNADLAAIYDKVEIGIKTQKRVRLIIMENGKTAPR